MTWLIYALLVVCGASGIHIFAKLSGQYIQGDLGILIATAAAFCSALAFYVVKLGVPDFTGVNTTGAVYVGLVGVSITVAHLAIFYMYEAQAPLSIAVPIVRIGAVVVVVLVGVLLMGEHMKPVNMAGVALSALALMMIMR